MSNRSTREVIVSEAISKLRQCLLFLLPGVDYPKLDRNVQYELHKLGMTPRDVKGLYRTFQNVKVHDPITANIGPEEASTASVLRLIKHRREWVSKILRNVLELGGFVEVVTWNGFLYVLLKFCQLSKMELAQVMFYIIARDQKSWTVHYLTTAQLEEFYEDFEGCPHRSFNTGAVGFSALALAKFGMVDFIELTYRFSQLVAPIVHLQRSVKQCFPGMQFWRDYDKVKLRNNKITLDYFRLQKVKSLVEVVRDKKRQEQEILMQLTTGITPPVQIDNSRPETWVDPKIDPLDPRTQVRRYPKVAADLPIPLPGPEGNKPGPPGWIPPRGYRPPVPPPLPAWIAEKQAKNLDPRRGTLLGQKAEPPELPNWAKPSEDQLTVEMAKVAIEDTHKRPGYDAELENARRQQQALQSMAGTNDKMEAMGRFQELDFIRKARGTDTKPTNMLAIMEKVTQCEVISRSYALSRKTAAYIPSKREQATV